MQVFGEYATVYLESSISDVEVKMTYPYRPHWANAKAAPWLWNCEQLFLRDVFYYYDKEEQREGILSDDVIYSPHILDILYRLASDDRTDRNGYKALGYGAGAGRRRRSNDSFHRHVTWLVKQKILIPHRDNGGKLRMLNRFKLNLKWDGDGGHRRRRVRFETYKLSYTKGSKGGNPRRSTRRKKAVTSDSTTRAPLERAVRTASDHETADSSVDFQSHDLGARNAE